MEKVFGIKFNTLETERLILREITSEKLKEIFSKLTDEQIMEIMDLKSQNEVHIEKFKFKAGVKTYYIDFKKWILVDKESLKSIGRCSFHTWIPVHSKAEIGYIITDEKYRNQGYMSEAMEKILDYGFTSMKLNKIYAGTSSDNFCSQKLLEKFNFKFDYIIREDHWSGEKFLDTLRYSLLKREYQ